MWVDRAQRKNQTMFFHIQRGQTATLNVFMSLLLSRGWTGAELHTYYLGFSSCQVIVISQVGNISQFL
jgi:hypothetical protein